MVCNQHLFSYVIETHLGQEQPSQHSQAKNKSANIARPRTIWPTQLGQEQPDQHCQAATSRPISFQHRSAYPILLLGSENYEMYTSPPITKPIGLKCLDRKIQNSLPILNCFLQESLLNWITRDICLLKHNDYGYSNPFSFSHPWPEKGF